MKKFFNKIHSKATELAIRTKTALASKSGEGYIDTAVKIIIPICLRISRMLCRATHYTKGYN